MPGRGAAERRLLHFWRSCMRTNIYIDGFNLYYGAVKDTAYKWLDLNKLSRSMLSPENQIVTIKYFTARVKPMGLDPTKPIKQETYLRALKTLPNVQIYFGHFLTNEFSRPLADDRQGGPQLVKVHDLTLDRTHPQFKEALKTSPIIRRPLAKKSNGLPQQVRIIGTNEKGSDVNLAVQLLHDAHRKTYEVAVVISNDSDLVSPIQIIIKQLRLKVGVINPQVRKGITDLHPSMQLKKTASFYKEISEEALRKSQFPPIMKDTVGEFHKPTSW